MFFTRLNDLFTRLAAYSGLVVAFELAIIWVCVYAIVRFVQGTRAAGALKGLLVLGVVVGIAARVLGGAEVFQRIGLLYDRLLAFLAIGLVVIFQPELRRALVRLGETPFFRSSPKEIALVIDEICEACKNLSRARFGAIIVIERSIAVAGAVEGGTPMNAELSSRLLQTIFFPGSALHDLAVVIKGKRIAAAGVQLPLAEPDEMPDKRLGSRHRAAVGVSKECDAIVVIVSEESGQIRIAERGRLMLVANSEELEIELKKRLHPQAIKKAIDDAIAAAAAESGSDESPALNPANEATNAFEPIGTDQAQEEEFGKGAA
ncbi:MAG: diadenylate cyclase CdaA [Phycisphaeraceae bacterium]|nr:diadenylate cyclase CdaA [Phycisphaeraceae bacterium]